jgi:hypothetical protein
MPLPLPPPPPPPPKPPKKIYVDGAHSARSFEYDEPQIIEKEVIEASCDPLFFPGIAMQT